MPTLEQKEDGDYYIRSYIHARGSIVTWQVRGSGITYLNRQGVFPGNTFPQTFLNAMIKANYVFTNGLGAQGRITEHSNQASIGTTHLHKNPPLKSTLLKTPPQLDSMQRGQATRHNIRNSMLLVLRQCDKQWELQIVFPKLLGGQTIELLTNDYSFTIVTSSTIATLKKIALLQEYSEAFLAVTPQINNYIIKLDAPKHSTTRVWSLLKRVNIVPEIKGLCPSGTIFRKQNNLNSSKNASRKSSFLNAENTRLDTREQMICGQSYFLVFHSTCEPRAIPHSILVHPLKNIGYWKAREIHLPMKSDTTLERWCASLGYRVRQ